MSDIDELAGGMECYRFAGPNSFEPLPITALVARTLEWARAHYDLLNVAAATLRRFQERVELGDAPAVSFRKGDSVDRYDMKGLFLYVRTDLVILIAGNRMVYASAEAGTISIRTVTPFSAARRQKEGILLEEAL